ncbi:unnamed protein product, partial [Polarella glacialis]
LLNDFNVDLGQPSKSSSSEFIPPLVCEIFELLAAGDASLGCRNGENGGELCISVEQAELHWELGTHLGGGYLVNTFKRDDRGTRVGTGSPPSRLRKTTQTPEDVVQKGLQDFLGLEAIERDSFLITKFRQLGLSCAPSVAYPGLLQISKICVIVFHVTVIFPGVSPGRPIHTTTQLPDGPLQLLWSWWPLHMLVPAPTGLAVTMPTAFKHHTHFTQMHKLLAKSWGLEREAVNRCIRAVLQARIDEVPPLVLLVAPPACSGLFHDFVLI